MMRPRTEGGVVALRIFRRLPTLCVLMCAACATFAPPERGHDELPLPAEYSLYEGTVAQPDRWWDIFESAELNDLLDRALDGNLGVQRVHARLMQAEAVARQAGAALWPEVEYSGETSITRRQTDTGVDADPMRTATTRLNAFSTLAGAPSAVGTGQDPVMAALRDAESRLRALDSLLDDPPSSRNVSTSRSYRFGLGSRYEVDLWGRVRAQREAARLGLDASREDLYAAMLSLSGAVVRQWLSIAAYRQQIALLEKQIELNRTTLELMEVRYRNGLATALDVFQQRQILAQTQSLQPSLEAGLQTGLQELAALLGAPPNTPLGLAVESLPPLGPLPEPGLPADLLASRPDVRASGLDLRAADWRVAAARADRLPALRLSGSAAYAADQWELVFNNWAATLAASITGPVFDAGRREAEVLRTRAVAEERLAAYRETVLYAVTEVEGLMILESKQAEYIAALERELETVRETYEQALFRYRQGLNDYLPVLSALSQLQVLERRRVQAAHTRLEYRARLCVALGGAWMREAADAPLAEAGDPPTPGQLGVTQ